MVDALIRLQVAVGAVARHEVHDAEFGDAVDLGVERNGLVEADVTTVAGRTGRRVPGGRGARADDVRPAAIAAVPFGSVARRGSARAPGPSQIAGGVIPIRDDRAVRPR